MRKPCMKCPACDKSVTQEVRTDKHNGRRVYSKECSLNSTGKDISVFQRLRLCHLCFFQYRTVEIPSNQFHQILDALKKAKSDLEKSKRESGRLRHQLVEARVLAVKIGNIGKSDDTREALHDYLSRIAERP